MAFGLDEFGKAVVLFAQLGEYGGRDEVDQTVFNRPRRETHFVAAQQAGLAEDIALAQTVVQRAITPVDFHRAAAYIVQLVNRSAIQQDVCAGLEVRHLNLPGNGVEAVIGQRIEGREALQVIADFQ